MKLFPKINHKTWWLVVATIAFANILAPVVMVVISLIQLQSAEPIGIGISLDQKFICSWWPHWQPYACTSDELIQNFFHKLIMMNFAVIFIWPLLLSGNAILLLALTWMHHSIIKKNYLLQISSIIISFILATIIMVGFNYLGLISFKN